MTREERKTSWIREGMEEAIEQYNIPLSEAKNIIDQMVDNIYDDFKNRTCSNCKHFNEPNDSCNNGVFTNWKHEINTPEEFGCNKFESK